MFKLKSFDSTIEKEKTILGIKKKLEQLTSLIKEIKYFEIGINKIESKRAFDIVLISTFESIKDLEIYSAHPEHQKVVKSLTKDIEISTSVDFEY